MRVLVLGGTGLFGRKTIVRLARDPAVTAVVAADVAPLKPWVLKEVEAVTDKVKYARVDVAELEDIVNAIKTYQINRLVNFAFLLPGNVETQPRLGTKVNAMGMCNAFEAARLTGISRVIYASSEGVYGPQDEYGDRDVTEDDRRHPGSGYALMKLYAEIIADQYSQYHGLKMTALRPHIGYGHGGLMPLMIKQFCDLVSLPAVGKPFSVDADGTTQVSLTSADDVGEFTRILLHADSSPHPAYNIGGPPMSMRDVAAVVNKYFPDAQINFGKQSPPPERGKTGIPWRLSMARAKQDFNFAPLPLEEAIHVHINDARLEAGLPTVKAKR